MLSTTAEYALRIVTHLAVHEDERQTSEDISKATRVPPDYALKILHALGRAGFVHSQRGRGGGFTLDCDIEKTTLFDIVDLIDPVQRIRSCPLGLHEHRTQLCTLHRSLDEIMALLEERLKGFTIADLAKERRRPGLCRTENTQVRVAAPTRRKL